ncbi:MAG TPA: hypothetical protein VLA89_12750 [Gemmatimonadales bacterium]|nr:hypothetical protein [Gemmatimonadales bacterium]
MASRRELSEPTLEDVLRRYDELDDLLSKARYELLQGAGAEGIRLAAGIVQKTYTLDRMIAKLLPEARDAHTMRIVERNTSTTEAL